MTTLDHTDSDIDTDGEGQGNDSSVIRALRDKIKSLESQTAEADEIAQKAVESYKAQVARTDSARELVSEFGYPGLAGDVAEKVEGEITKDKVVDFLKSRDLPLSVTEGSDDEGETSTGGESVANVADLAQQVAAAAGNDGDSDFAQKLAETKNVDEVARLMRESGLAQ